MDLQLENGDLVLSSTPEIDTLVNRTILDLVIANREDELHTLVRRTFITPLGYIKFRVLDALGSRYIDYEYGDGIYLTLSQPMKTTLIKTVESFVIDCIKQLPPPITINKYQIEVINIDSVQVRINYSLNHNDINETLIVIEV